MTDADSNLDEGLRKIKREAEEVLESLEQIKQNANNQLLPEFEKAEKSGWNWLFEIEEITKKLRSEITPADSTKRSGIAQFGKVRPFTVLKVGSNRT